MLHQDEKFKLAQQVVQAIQTKEIEIKANTEKEAVSKLNKAMKNPEGYGYKIYKSKGYFGKYEVGKTWKNRKEGITYTEFSLYEKEQGIYAVAKGGNGYNGID